MIFKRWESFPNRPAILGKIKAHFDLKWPHFNLIRPRIDPNLTNFDLWLWPDFQPMNSQIDLLSDVFLQARPIFLKKLLHINKTMFSHIVLKGMTLYLWFCLKWVLNPLKAQYDSSQGTASRNTKLVVNSKRFEFRKACTKSARKRETYGLEKLEHWKTWKYPELRENGRMGTQCIANDKRTIFG